MVILRRGYIFLISAVTLQATAWAMIYLLRNLFPPGATAPSTAMAFQIAVIVVTLPIYVAHWRWAERLAARDPDERMAVVRAVYLYGMLAAFLLPWLANAVGLIRSALQLAMRIRVVEFQDQVEPGQSAADALIALIVLGLLWLYHWRVLGADGQIAPLDGARATVRRLYVLGFCAAGLTMTTTGFIHLLRWVLYQLGRNAAIIQPSQVSLTNDVARLAVGLPLWLVCWSWANHLVRGPSEEERRSALRWLYLYVVIFVTVIATVINGAMIVIGLFRRLLALPATGDIRGPLPVIVGALAVWLYHAAVLRRDAAMIEEQPRQAGIRRLYHYLVAAVGLAAVLIGLGGVVSVLIRLGTMTGLVTVLKGQLAIFAGVLCVGLPVWLLPWRRSQTSALDPGTEGAEERRSLVRKFYLYVVLLATGITVVASSVYIVYRLVSLVLGVSRPANQGANLAQAIAFALIAGTAWVYHSHVLRRDGALGRAELVRRAAGLRVVVADVGDGRFATDVISHLQRELPELTPQLVVVGPEVDEAQLAALREADVIAGPWLITTPGGAGGTVSEAVAQAVNQSAARKLLVPVRDSGWEWAGVDRWTDEALVGQTVYALRRMVQGDEVAPERPLGVGAIVAIAIGVVVLLGLLGIPVFFLLQGID